MKNYNKLLKEIKNKLTSIKIEENSLLEERSILETSRLQSFINDANKNNLWKTKIRSKNIVSKPNSYFIEKHKIKEGKQKGEIIYHTTNSIVFNWEYVEINIEDDNHFLKK